jgi:pectinesterase
MANKAALTLLVSILVVVACAGAIIAVVHTSKARSDIPSAPGSSPGMTVSISKLCSPAMYQDSCQRTLSQISSVNGSASPADVFKAFVEVAAKEFEAAASRSADVIKGKAPGPAGNACQNLLSDGLEYLTELLASLQGKDVQALLAEADTIKHTISASMTLMYTCADSIDEPALNSQMNSVLSNATEMSSNALAVIASISSVETELENLSGKGASRRLMGNELDEEGYPTWLISGGDRKQLLQTPRKDVKPHAVVAKDGSGQYKSINEAIRNMPIKETGLYVIYVKAGVYDEIVRVEKNKNNLFIYGDGPLKTIVTGDRSKNITHYSTSDSATFGELIYVYTYMYILIQN